jgi:hypothetical protein
MKEFEFEELEGFIPCPPPCVDGPAEFGEGCVKYFSLML